MGTPRNTSDLIARTAEDGKAIRDAAEFWQRLSSNRFIEAYHGSLLAHGVPKGQADELTDVIRHYIERIDHGLQDADYMLKELAGELADAKSKATRESPESFFRI